MDDVGPISAAPASSEPRPKPPADRFASRYPEAHFDALLVVAFGGPEGPDDVMPFLENVTRGRGVPRARLEEVADHYGLFDGVSPINEQNRELIRALRVVLDERDVGLPIYFGNRNWHPYLNDVIGEMHKDGVERSLALFTTAYSSYSSCRQYRENLYAAQVACGPDAPEILRLRAFYNHPGFIEANASRLEDAMAGLSDSRRTNAHVVFTAHSIPTAMAATCSYSAQLEETAQLVAEAVAHDNFELVYQSRSGSPHVPWLEPDVCDHLRSLSPAGVKDVVLSPVGFLSDHIEVLFDLDIEAREVANEVGIELRRASAVGTHPLFVAMLADLVEERLAPENGARAALGAHGPSPDVCGASCCLRGNGQASPWDDPA